MKSILFLASLFAFSKSACAQDITSVEKTGWLLYNSDKVIWFESAIMKKASNEAFFKKQEYVDGLIVNYIPEAKYYKSIAKGYQVKTLVYENNTQKADYSSTDSIWILPVKVKFTRLTRPVSEILTPMGLSFMKGENEVTLAFNFETSYDVTDVKLLRNCDNRRLRRVKNYEVYPSH